MTPDTLTARVSKRVKQLEAMLERIENAGDIADRFHGPNEECIADGVESLVEDYESLKARLAEVERSLNDTRKELEECRNRKG